MRDDITGYARCGCGWPQVPYQGALVCAATGERLDDQHAHDGVHIDAQDGFVWAGDFEYGTPEHSARWAFLDALAASDPFDGYDPDDPREWVQPWPDWMLELEDEAATHRPESAAKVQRWAGHVAQVWPDGLVDADCTRIFSGERTHEGVVPNKGSVRHNGLAGRWVWLDNMGRQIGQWVAVQPVPVTDELLAKLRAIMDEEEVSDDTE